jgi:hypothetical protein
VLKNKTKQKKNPKTTPTTNDKNNRKLDLETQYDHIQKTAGEPSTIRIAVE